jgi:hypothetical protein
MVMIVKRHRKSKAAAKAQNAKSLAGCRQKIQACLLTNAFRFSAAGNEYAAAKPQRRESLGFLKRLIGEPSKETLKVSVIVAVMLIAVAVHMLSKRLVHDFNLRLDSLAQAILGSPAHQMRLAVVALRPKGRLGLIENTGLMVSAQKGVVPLHAGLAFGLRMAFLKVK